MTRARSAGGAPFSFSVRVRDVYQLPRRGSGNVSCRLSGVAHSRDWIVPMARIGFAVKGVVYLLLGGLALRAAAGVGGRLTDPRGVEVALRRGPFGSVVLAALAAGLAMYAGWRFLEAFADANGKGRSRGAIAARAVYALSGAIYAALAADAVRLVLGSSGGGGAQHVLPTTLIGAPMARWLLLIVAAAIVVYGVMQGRAAFSRQLSDQLNIRKVSHHAGELVVRISRVGLAARAVVLVALGVVLFRARANPSSAAANTDIGDSLRLLAALPTGGWLMLLVGAGLMAYGVFQLVQARYREITPP